MPLLGEFAIAFTAGLVATSTPCILPLYPGYIAYIAGRAQIQQRVSLRYTIGLLVLTGILTTLIVIGAALALLHLAVSDAMSIAVPFAYGAIIVLGIFMLADINPFMKISDINVPVFKSAHTNAYVYGVLYAPIAFPCSGPLLVSIFALSFTVTEVAELTGLFLMFGLGMGMPLMLIAIITETYQRKIVSVVTRNTRLVNVLSGVVFLAMGVYGFWTNWAFLKLYIT